MVTKRKGEGGREAKFSILEALDREVEVITLFPLSRPLDMG